jgi:hypothetical protein
MIDWPASPIIAVLLKMPLELVVFVMMPNFITYVCFVVTSIGSTLLSVIAINACQQHMRSSLVESIT